MRSAGPGFADAYLLNLQLLLHHTNKYRLCLQGEGAFLFIFLLWDKTATKYNFHYQLNC